jgi:hypothetical protein
MWSLEGKLSPAAGGVEFTLNAIIHSWPALIHSHLNIELRLYVNRPAAAPA